MLASPTVVQSRPAHHHHHHPAPRHAPPPGNCQAQLDAALAGTGYTGRCVAPGSLGRGIKGLTYGPPQNQVFVEVRNDWPVTIRHEACHAKNFDAGHGPAFNACMGS